MTLGEAKDILSNLFFDDHEFAVRTGEYMCISGEKTGEKVKEAIDTVLKALEEQQKEIEEIKTENENLTLSQLDFTKRHISKDKIREKIKERESKRDNAEMNFTSALFERDINLLEELIKE